MSDITNIQMTGMTPGTVYKINMPIKKELGAGFSPKTGTIDIDGKTYTLKVGFLLINEDEGIGELIDKYPKEVAIAYKPAVFGEATIYFYASTGEIVRFGMMPTDIHDHASITTGGPAYGTYFTDLSSLESGE